jgi:putative ABC transport system substrate-binding protein
MAHRQGSFPASRREFITLLGGGATAAWPMATWAQPRAMPVIGLLSIHTPEVEGPNWAVFLRSLRAAGFVEGENISIEYRYASYRSEQLPIMAADLVQRRVALIAAGPVAPEVAKAATTTIPIVFVNGGDPVRSGLVASLNRPGGNLTGVSLLANDLAPKRFGLLRDIVPQAARIGLLVDPTLQQAVRQRQSQELEDAARKLGVSLREVAVGSDRNLDAAFATLVEERVDALFVGAGTYFFGARTQLVAFAAQYRIPAMYELREFMQAGGLAMYGTSVPDAFRKAGLYAARILKGAKPADLPIDLPTKFEFLLNLKTAKALGLTIPIDALTIADEVIE